MTVVGYPSSDFPPPPRCTLRIPEDWRAAWPVGTLMAVHGPAGEDGVTPNIMVAHQRLPEAAGLDELVAATVGQLRGGTPPRQVEEPRRVRVADAIDAVVLSASFTADTGADVVQRQLILQLESPGGGSAVLEVTGTCGASGVSVLEEIMDSFEFAPAPMESLLPEAAR